MAVRINDRVRTRRENDNNIIMSVNLANFRNTLLRGNLDLFSFGRFRMALCRDTLTRFVQSPIYVEYKVVF